MATMQMHHSPYSGVPRHRPLSPSPYARPSPALTQYRRPSTVNPYSPYADIRDFRYPASPPPRRPSFAAPPHPHDRSAIPRPQHSQLRPHPYHRPPPPPMRAPDGQPRGGAPAKADEQRRQDERSVLPPQYRHRPSVDYRGLPPTRSSLGLTRDVPLSANRPSVDYPYDAPYSARGGDPRERATGRSAAHPVDVDAGEYAPSRGAQRDANYTEKEIERLRKVAEAEAELAYLKDEREREVELRLRRLRYEQQQQEQYRREGIHDAEHEGMRRPDSQAIAEEMRRRSTVPPYVQPPSRRGPPLPPFSDPAAGYARRPSTHLLPLARAGAAPGGDRRGSLLGGPRMGDPRQGSMALGPQYRGISPLTRPDSLYPSAIDRRGSLATTASSHRRPSGPPPMFGLGLEARQREALLREQGVAIDAARKAVAEAKTKAAEVADQAAIEKEKERQKRVEEVVDDPARRRRVQGQVFVHARPTYCRWGDCQAVLNSWGLLEKHIHHAHIKPLPSPTTDEADESGKKTEYRCHWGTCTKTYNDKERTYRHCLVEHMGEFCARCPFDCLYEGPTFPSLMAHIGRRHPNATPDDLVPGLIHFKPSVQALPPLPDEAIITPPTKAAELDSSSTTCIVAPYQPIASEICDLKTLTAKPRVSRPFSKRGSDDGSYTSAAAGPTRAELTQRRRSDTDKKIAGRVIAEVVSRVVAAAAEQRRAASLPAVEVKTGYVSPAGSEAPEEATGKIDVKAIVKSVRAAVKAESSAPPASNTASPVVLPLTFATLTALPVDIRVDDTRKVAYTVSESEVAAPGSPVPAIIDEAPVEEEKEDIWAKLGFGTRTSVGNRYTTPVPAPKTAAEVKCAADPSPTSSLSPESSTGTGGDSMDYVPPRSITVIEPADRETRRLASIGGLAVKVEAGGESQTPSPTTSELKVRLKVPRSESGKRAREDTAETEEEKEARWKLRPRRQVRVNM